MLVEVIFIETVPNKTSTNILIYILLSILLRLTGKRDRLLRQVDRKSILGKDISTCPPVSLMLDGMCYFGTLLINLFIRSHTIHLLVLYISLWPYRIYLESMSLKRMLVDRATDKVSYLRPCSPCL